MKERMPFATTENQQARAFDYRIPAGAVAAAMEAGYDEEGAIDYIMLNYADYLALAYNMGSLLADLIRADNEQEIIRLNRAKEKWSWQNRRSRKLTRPGTL